MAPERDLTGTPEHQRHQKLVATEYALGKRRTTPGARLLNLALLTLAHPNWKPTIVITETCYPGSGTDRGRTVEGTGMEGGMRDQALEEVGNAVVKTLHLTNLQQC